ncbi:malto-oligosyltrehalose trehalohydrolase [Chitinophaga agrisoli]|uniref:Malto-oligosyltrehalose trehalohydrolase n=1 Tax=Chitinophaga agrisoli TaxID=2607653 RepID=A0A5B2VV15_9BACT|nr:malto-oligosyltrehalose trehalohydrolase [Chitinophaga agrisoli]KAA2243633.1 malto-oligosyltrehalose trehalohydrolase [Chitinophaga agrisoli]
MATSTYKQTGALLAASGICTFRVWAPFREKLALLLPESNATYAMERDGEGYWEVQIPGIGAGTLYQFVLDNDLQRPDPASRWQPQGVHGPSAVTDPAGFSFTDAQWKGMDTADMILYELHIGTFTPEGTIDALTTRLPWLQELGITAIEIMPVAQFPGNRNWGYDGVFPYALQNTYGNINDLKKLVNAAHKLGMAVILDVVYNHQGPEGNYLGDYGPYFTDKYHTPWGKAINFDDACCDPVRAFYIQNALMWLDEFHIDGLRLDAVHAYWDSSALHFTQELAAAVQELEMRTGRKKTLIGEIDLNNPRYITPIPNGGYGLDAQWVDEFHHALHSCLTGEQQGYYEDFGDLALLAKSYADAYVYTGQYSVHRKRKFGVKPDQHAYTRFVTFIQNHDQIGNRMLGERLGVLLPFEAQKLSAAALLLSPFVPLLFMGEEYGEKNPFPFFCSFEDADLVQAVREGRKREFAAFHLNGEAQDPQAEEVFASAKLSWQTQAGEHAALLALYQFLINLRKTHAALRNRQRSNTKVHAPVNNAVLVIERRSPGKEALLLLLNFSKTEQAWHPPSAIKLRKLFDSAGEQWNGPGALAPDEAATGGTMSIQPLSAVVYEMI